MRLFFCCRFRFVLSFFLMMCIVLFSVVFLVFVLLCDMVLCVVVMDWSSVLNSRLISWCGFVFCMLVLVVMCL